MKARKVFLIIWSILLVSNLCAEDHPTGSLLWKISGNGLEKPSFVFGTYHGSTDITLDFLDSIPRFYNAFGSVTQFVGEQSGAEGEEGLKMLFGELGEIKLSEDMFYSDLLSEPDIVYLDSVLRKYIDSKSSEVRVSPNFLLVILAQMKNKEAYTGSLGEDAQMIMDSYLMQKALENHYILKGLDNPEIYKRFFKDMYFEKGIPTTFQDGAEYLMKRLKENDKKSEELDIVNENFVNAYRIQDLKSFYEAKKKQLSTLAKINPEEDLTDWVQDFLVKERNQLWMEKIPGLMEKEPSFIAVGALHLCGEEGLLHQLKLKGYKVEALKEY